MPNDIAGLVDNERGLISRRNLYRAGEFMGQELEGASSARCWPVSLPRTSQVARARAIS